MIEAVDFISKETFQTLRPAESGWAALSLGNPAEMPPDNLHHFAAALRLEFMDLTLDTLERYGMPPEVLCQPEQMAEVVRFIQALHASPAPIRLVVHCHMGLSRSAALALMAHEMTGCAFPRKADAHYANRHLVSLATAHLGAPLTPPPIPDIESVHAYLPKALAI